MSPCCFFFFFFNAPAPTEIYPLSYTTLFRSYTDSGGAGVASQLAAGGGFLPSPVAGVVEITSGGTTKNYIFVTDNPLNPGGIIKPKINVPKKRFRNYWREKLE